MIPSRELLSRPIHIDFLGRQALSPAKWARCVAFCLLMLTGCSSQKQTWRDWMKTPAQNPIPVQSMANNLPTNSVGVLAPRYKIGDGAHVAPGFDVKMRNPDFPQTHIECVCINLSNPTNGLTLRWTGPHHAEGPVGPWRITPGRGSEGHDCDTVEDSNTVDSLCTPKGNFPVAGFADHLEQTPICRYATWVLYAPRYIAIHSHTELPPTPASAGCIRVPYEAAKLIHNNSLVGETIVSIGGTWHRPVPLHIVSQTSTTAAVDAHPSAR